MYKKCLIFLVLAIFMISGVCLAKGVELPKEWIPHPPAVSAQELMNPDMFPNAQCGMAVESVQDGPISKVITTGGEFIINKAKDSIECRQRISKQREVATIRLTKGTLEGIKLTDKSTGMAIFSGSGGTVRINGDSLLMVKPKKDGTIKAALAFVPDYHTEFHGNYNFFDPDGGISFFEHSKSPDPEFQGAYDPVTVTWSWKGGDVFWAGVSPPKPYDWDYPLKHRVICYGNSSDNPVYPTAEQLPARNDEYCSILYIHFELQWKHWNLDLTPKNPAGLRRLANDAHERGHKVIVYMSPSFFLKHTPGEALAIEDPHHIVRCLTGHNARLYLDYATKMVKDSGVDGLYWDGMYTWVGALATNYWLTRTARDLLGTNGVLDFHATRDIFGYMGSYLTTYCPTQQAYCDIVMKGEGQENREDPGYLRYIGSTYNISNSMAIACMMNAIPTKHEVNRSLKNNLHLLYAPNWLDSDNPISKDYWPRLKPSLKGEISSGLGKRTGNFEQWRKSIYKK